MADQKDLDYTYSFIDNIFRLGFGETGDFSGAMYNGDFSLSLEQAQNQKYEFIAKSLNIGESSRVLDIGCGWGPFLKFLKDEGAIGVGVTLSNGQARACQKNGLDVQLMDCKTIEPKTFGTFDAITCIGAFEAFCSKKEWEEGKQEKIYNNFFKVVYDLLPAGGRFYMQTMVFSKNMIDPTLPDINADKNSDAYICALLQRQFPGHWLPLSDNQVIECTKPYFKLISKSSGRLDYIETQKQWRKKFRGFSLRKYLVFLSLIPRYLTKKKFRERLALFKAPANRICFEREILDHYRLVFEKA